MTENETIAVIEALEEVQQYRELGTIEELVQGKKYIDLAKQHGTVGRVIENCIAYEKIGTPEECQTAMELYKEMHKRKFTLEAAEEYMKFEEELVRRGFTFGNLLEIMKKSTPQNPDLEGDGYSDGNLVYDTWICPCCGKHYEIDYEKYDYCPNCGQAIDWSKE